MSTCLDLRTEQREKTFAMSTVHERERPVLGSPASPKNRGRMEGNIDGIIPAANLKSTVRSAYVSRRIQNVSRFGSEEQPHILDNFFIIQTNQHAGFAPSSRLCKLLITYLRTTSDELLIHSRESRNLTRSIKQTDHVKNHPNPNSPKSVRLTELRFAKRTRKHNPYLENLP